MVEAAATFRSEDELVWLSLLWAAIIFMLGLPAVHRRK